MCSDVRERIADRNRRDVPYVPWLHGIDLGYLLLGVLLMNRWSQPVDRKSIAIAFGLLLVFAALSVLSAYSQNNAVAIVCLSVSLVCAAVFLFVWTRHRLR